LIGLLFSANILRVDVISAADKSSIISENISLNINVDRNYKASLIGSINLTNKSNRNVSIKDYKFVIPHFKLKGISIQGLKKYLIDSYVDGNSTVFQIKSPYIKPVILSRNQTLSITFEAEIIDLFEDYIGFRCFTVPFTIDSENINKYNMEVNLSKDLPIVYAPKRKNYSEVEGVYRFDILGQDNKSFCFVLKDVNLGLKLTSGESNHFYFPSESLSKYKCVETSLLKCNKCENSYFDTLGNFFILSSNADKKEAMIKVKVDKTCLLDLYKNFSNSKDGTYFGYNIDILTGDLLPSTLSNELLYIPIGICNNENDCKNKLHELATYKAEIVDIDSLANSDLTISPVARPLIVNISSCGPDLCLNIKNNSNNYLKVNKLSIDKNNIFQLPQDEINKNHLLLPGGSKRIKLISSKNFITNSLTVDINVNINDNRELVRYSVFLHPRLRLILTISKFLVILIAIFFSSGFYVIMYNKKYGGKN